MKFYAATIWVFAVSSLLFLQLPEDGGANQAEVTVQIIPRNKIDRGILIVLANDGTPFIRGKKVNLSDFFQRQKEKVADEIAIVLIASYPELTTLDTINNSVQKFKDGMDSLSANKKSIAITSAGEGDPKILITNMDKNKVPKQEKREQE